MKPTRRKFLEMTALASVAPFGAAKAQTLPLVRIVAAAPVMRPDLAYQFLGIPMGYYQKLGYRGDFMTVAGSAAALQLVLGGAGEVASIGFLELISAKQKQPDLPIISVYSHEKVSAYQIVVLPESPIQSVADFKGKTIGVPNLASGTIPLTKGMLFQAGVDPKTVSLLPIGTGPQALSVLKNKQVDAISTHIGQIAAMEILGQEFRYFSARIPAAGFVMSRAYVANNRELAVRILQGMILNQMIMLKDPAAVVRAYWKQNGKPAGDVEKAMRDGVHFVTRTASGFKPLNDPTPWGLYTDADWKELNNFVGSEGLIPANAALSQFYTPELIADANKVDISLAGEAIKAFAG